MRVATAVTTFPTHSWQLKGLNTILVKYHVFVNKKLVLIIVRSVDCSIST